MTIENNNIYDVCIIGGGINGAGIAAKLSNHHVTTFLCEKNDFAGATSSNTTKLIHGGLRYLEQYNFKLVRAALKERSILQTMAPHITWPIEFIFINNNKIRNSLLVRTGLLLYDCLSIGFTGRRYHKTRKVNLDHNNLFKTGYVYTDLWVDDARLVIENIIEADLKGACVNKNTEFLSAHYLNQEKLWSISLINHKTNHNYTIFAKTIINTSGPWVNDVLSKIKLSGKSLLPQNNIRLVKGSHIIVEKLYDDHESYVLQNQDGRIVFVIPYEEDFTLIGTTELEYDNAQLINKPVIDQEEINYLLASYNNYFKKKLSKNDIKFSFSGVRPLVYDPHTKVSDNTRDYKIDVYPDISNNSLINIYGGKMTTYRLLADEVFALVKTNLSTRNHDNGSVEILTSLPGGNITPNNNQGLGYYKTNHQFFTDKLRKDFPCLSKKLCSRYTRTYGSRSYNLLEGVKKIDDLGQHFGAELYQKEVDYLIKSEFAISLDDIIWRRTKLGLFLSKPEIDHLAVYIKNICSN